MKQIELYINNKLVDLDNQFNVRLNKQLYNLNTIDNIDINYSFTLSIPVTINNKMIFNYNDVEEVPNKFNQIYDAQLYINSILILDGKYINQEIEHDYYYGNLYKPTKKSLKDIFNDLNMNQIIKHEKNISSFEYIYDINRDTLDDWYKVDANNHICFPYILYNLPFNDDKEHNMSKYQQLTFYNKDTYSSDLSIEDMIPAFNVTSVIKDIFKTFDLNVVGNIFNDMKFNKLYQSYHGSMDDLYNSRNLPYYLKCNIGWQARNLAKNSTCSTLKQFTNKDGLRMVSGDLLASNNIEIRNLTDEFRMMTDPKGGYIKIPKSGWYRIGIEGGFQYDNEPNKLWEEENRISVSGDRCTYDMAILSSKPFEFQVLKGKSPNIESGEMVGVYGFQPSMSRTDGGRPFSYKIYGDSDNGVMVSYSNQNFFPKNNSPMLIFDSDKPNTDNFVMGAHFGIYNFHISDRNPDYINAVGSMLYNNPDPLKYKFANNNYYQYCFPYPTDETAYTKQANPLLRISGNNVRAFANSNGYTAYKCIQYNDEVLWEKQFLPSEYNMYYFDGLDTSSATVVDESTGNFKLDQVIWLDKDEYITMFALMPLMEYGIYQNGKWRWRTQTCVRTVMNMKFQMGIINSDPDWNYENQKIPDWNEIESPRMTNVNAFLPKDIKINDYVNSFIDMFNLKLTQLNSNTYSIDSITTNNTITDIIDIEPYVDINKNKYKKIDFPSEYQFNFKIDTSEEGYVQEGTHNTESKQYTGNGLYINPASTNGSVIKKDSIFSFCWYKEIEFVGYHNHIVNTPIISNSNIWQNTMTYENAKKEGFFTDKNIRLFYLENKNFFYNYIVNQNNYEIYFFGTSNISPDGILELTFDKTRPNSITNKLFNIKQSTSHEVEVSLYLPTDLYNRINSSTKIKMNNDLYSIKEIEGFDPLEEEETLLKLIKE